MPPVGLTKCLRPGVRAAILCSRTRQQNQGQLYEPAQREFWPSEHRTAPALGNRTRVGCMNQGKEASLVQREVAANAAGGIGGVPPARCPGSHIVLPRWATEPGPVV